MKNKEKLILIGILLLFFIPNLTLAVDISFGNPVGTTGNITEFFESVLTGILNIIAFLGVFFIVIGGIIYLIASMTGNTTLILTAKKTFTGALVGLTLALAGPSFLKEIKAIVLDGAGVPTDINDAPSLSEILTRSLSFLLSVIGIIAILSLVINSILYLTSFGNPTKTEKIKTNITYSIIGLLTAGSALILVKQIIILIEN